MNKKKFFYSFFFLIFIFQTPVFSAIYLRDNLTRAQIGDYIVTIQNKTYTLLHVFDKTAQTLTIEEISIPIKKIPSHGFSWRNWVESGAPFNTSWLLYVIELSTGKIIKQFSFTKNEWSSLPDTNHLLSTLLNLRLVRVPLNQRKKIGPIPDNGIDWRTIWQPRLVVEGKVIPGIVFDVWSARWPKDGSELAGKKVEIYIPENQELYPSYFPYWLEIRGAIGKGKIRVIDSGTRLNSPKTAR